MPISNQPLKLLFQNLPIEMGDNLDFLEHASDIAQAIHGLQFASNTSYRHPINVVFIFYVDLGDDAFIVPHKMLMERQKSNILC